MKSHEVDETFHRLVDQYPHIFTDTKLIHELWQHGEATIAFRSLLDGLQEMDVEVDMNTRQQLEAIAGALDMLDDERGKGVYW